MSGKNSSADDYSASTMLRKRNIVAPPSTEKNDDAEKKEGIKDMKLAKDDCCSNGRTPDGKVFKVPATREMVQSLLDPNERKSWFDFVTLTTLLVQISFYFVLPLSFTKYLYIALFLFWRLAYNLGLGLLLKYQSENRFLVKMVKKYKIFDTQENPKVAKWLRTQLSLKMHADYDFDTAPIEYNTWLLYRQLVDLILMNDFGTYVCFAVAWFNTRPSSSFFMDDELRWIGGIFLIIFNIWVKLDAQRVVKDFAWYWGDFFFLIEQSLTFDGVFEMAPHPMYSVGYIGYYGISLICASYTVLFISIIAHVLQMAFLVLVETPHIEKTYNPPSTPKRQPVVTESLDEDATTLIKSVLFNNANFSYTHYFRRDLIVFKNFDLFQSSDLASGLVMVYAFFSPFFVSGSTGVAFAMCQALFWRIFHSGGMGWLLFAQSKNKFFTRHFVKWGGGVDDAFQNWKSIYNLSSCMTYVSFISLCLKLYSLPSDWTYGMTLLRHILGLAFISLHIWTSVSIYEVLGEFGWFYGDFFVDDHPTQLLYTGIYRFLNNPEKIMGHAAFWGFSLITNNHYIFALALFSQIANSLFLHFVEGPHMQKLYGDQIRKEAGLTKTLRTAAQTIPKKLPQNVLQEIEKFVHEQQSDNNKSLDGNTTQESAPNTMSSTNGSSKLDHVIKETIAKVEKVIGDTADTIGKAELAAALEATKLIDSGTTYGGDSSSDENMDVQKKKYSLKLSHFHHRPDQHTNDVVGNNIFAIGERIKVDWIAPEQHGPKDWIGIYRVTENPSKATTSVSSRGKWYWTNAAKSSSVAGGSAIEEDGLLFPPQVALKTSGSVVFKGDKLPWREGVYEIRYHHDGKHKVMARSIPFEITAPPTPDINDEDAIQLCLLRLVQSALENDPEKMPMSPIDNYTYLDEPSAKKLAYAIKMIFGVEFAWEVIMADTRVNRLTKRVQHALTALSPFSSQSSSSATNQHQQHHRKRSSLSSVSSMPSISTAAVNNQHPIAIAMQQQQQTLTERASIDDMYDIHESHGSASNAGGILFGSSPIRHSPLVSSPPR